ARRLPHACLASSLRKNRTSEFSRSDRIFAAGRCFGAEQLSGDPRALARCEYRNRRTVRDLVARGKFAERLVGDVAAGKTGACGNTNRLARPGRRSERSERRRARNK